MKLVLGWLYHDLMNTYGDRGNILSLIYRAKERGINIELKKISIGSNYKDLTAVDFFMMGGAEDRQQEIVAKDLREDKKKVLQNKIESGVPGLFICGAYQFLGKYYQKADKTIIECLNILPIYTEQNNKHSKRIIGDIVVKISNKKLLKSPYFSNNQGYQSTLLIGFENHGGRTITDDKSKTIGNTLLGIGNNEGDLTEGYIYKNSISTYLHGPVLPKNPQLADFILAKALEVKYNEKIILSPLEDALENKNRSYLLKKLNVR